MGELARVCAPGGRIIIVTWCHRCAYAVVRQLLAWYTQCWVSASLQKKAQSVYRLFCPWSAHGNKLFEPQKRSGTRHTGLCSPSQLMRSRPCPRNLRAGEAGLSADEQALLDRICEAYYLPAWCSIDDYRRIFEAQGLQARIALRLQQMTHHRRPHRLARCPPRAAVHRGAGCQRVLAAYCNWWAPAKCCHISLQESAEGWTPSSFCLACAVLSLASLAERMETHLHPPTGDQDRGLVGGGGAVLGRGHPLGAQRRGLQRPVQGRVDHHQGTQSGRLCSISRVCFCCLVLHVHPL